MAVELAEDLFDVTDGGPALLGSRCAGCGTHAFPQVPTCRNPACPGQDVAPARLGRTGRLWSWTVQAYRPPPLFQVDDWEPYAIGLVEVPEGLRVLALLTGCPVEELAVDLPLELVLHPLSERDGRRTTTYAYAPAVSA